MGRLWYGFAILDNFMFMKSVADIIRDSYPLDRLRGQFKITVTKGVRDQSDPPLSRLGNFSSGSLSRQHNTVFPTDLKQNRRKKLDILCDMNS